MSTETTRASKFNSSRKNTIVDQRVSTCTDCEKGIFTYHEYLWTSRGLVHKPCNDVRQDEIKVNT